MWQEWYRQYKKHIELVAVAVDNQSPDMILKWVREAKATYRVLHDRENLLYRQFRSPMTSTLLLDEQGRLVRPWKYADLLEPAFRREVSSWAETGDIPGPWLEEDITNAAVITNTEQREIYSLVHEATTLIDQGKKEEAIACLEEALTLDPQNYVILKQLGVLQRPDDYYKGDMPAINL